MFWALFCDFVLIMLIAGLGGIYYLYKVDAKNKKELKKFNKNIKLHANLGKVLIIYYSWMGHTKNIAEQIAQKTNADLFQIKTLEPYSSPSVYMKSKKELTSKKYPEINKDNLPNITKYDTIFIGAPVWWYTMAPALYSYLKETDFNGKNIVPFSTQSSNYGSFFEDFANVARNAQILSGEKFNNVNEKYQNQVSNKINAWLNRL